MKRIHLLLGLLVCAVLLTPFRTKLRDAVASVSQRSTVQERLEQYGPQARKRLAPYFTRAQVAYPPSRVVFAGFKQEKTLEVYAAGKNGTLRFIRAYPILAASGQLGPKLREGDLLVPEGFYRISFLNPNSAYHLSLRVDYPNAFDRRMAAKERRKDLGGDIMMHGAACSAGCLAMGDEAIEDLFVLAADTGRSQCAVLLSPVDFRQHAAAPALPSAPAWVADIHQQIATAVKKLPAPQPITPSGGNHRERPSR